MPKPNTQEKGEMIPEQVFQLPYSPKLLHRSSSQTDGSRLKGVFFAATAATRFKNLTKQKHLNRLKSPDVFHKVDGLSYLRFDFESSSNLSIDGTNRGNSPSPTNSPAPPDSAPRNYIQEGGVQFSTGVSSQARYLFLFNDILLIAKSKSVSTYKLKNRVRIDEMWIGTCIDEVAESTVAVDRSFVIGWPTTNYVASFSTVEEKELWWTSLRKCIHEQRDLEERKQITLKVCMRDMEESSAITKSFPVSNSDDAKTVTKMALDHFHITDEDTSDYQLWVISGKENAAYPLIGHEMPFAIKMNHIRESLLDAAEKNLNNNIENGPNIEALAPEAKCQFILKKARKTGARINLDIPSAQKRWRNPMKKSPIINWAMNKKGGKGHFPQDLIVPGKLFGLPLTSLTSNEELVPKPIEDLLVQLFRKGPSTVGVFRKSGLMKAVKQLRQALNEEIPVALDDKPAVLLGTILKEFFRSLPDCLFGSEFYEEFVATKELKDVGARVEEIKQILNKLPRPNQELIKRFLCLAYHIDKFSERNSMNASNLAVCIAPSLIWPLGQEKMMSPEATGYGADLICFTIENFVAIYGEDALTVLGPESDICLETFPEEDLDAAGEPIVFQCQQSDDGSDSPRRPPEFRTSLSYGGDYKDLQEGDEHSSDERLNLNNSLNLTSVSLLPGRIGDSKSSPSSPFPSRKRSPPKREALKVANLKHIENGFLDERDSLRRHSDQDLSEERNDRKNTKYTRVKRTLISTTTSAELIEHKRPFQNEHSPRLHPKSTSTGGASPQTVRVVSPSVTSPKAKQCTPEQPRTYVNQKTFFQFEADNSNVDQSSDLSDRLAEPNVAPRICSGGSNHGSETSSSDGLCSPHRSPVSSPTLRKKLQGSDGRQVQPDIVMQNFYRRQQPAAPSYDEYLQRRQLWQRQGATQRLGSDSDTSDKSNSPRAENQPGSQSETAPLGRKVELTLNVLDSDDKKMTFSRLRGDDEPVQSSVSDFGRSRDRSGSTDRETGRPRHSFEHDPGRVLRNPDRDHGRSHHVVDSRSNVKLSPRNQTRRVELSPKDYHEPSVYSRLADDSKSAQSRPYKINAATRPSAITHSNVESPVRQPQRSTQTDGHGRVTDRHPTNNRLAGIPVKSNLAHFPASAFFPAEAKPSLRSPVEVFSQNPWWNVNSVNQYGKKTSDKLDELTRKLTGSDAKPGIDNLESDAMTKDRTDEDISALSVPHLPDLETPTLEDFQNFMFQDESRV